MVCSSGGISPRKLTLTPLGGVPARATAAVSFGCGFAESHAVDIGGEADDALAVVALDEAGHGAGFQSARYRQVEIRTAVLHYGEAPSSSALCMRFCGSSTWIWKALPEFGSRQ